MPEHRTGIQKPGNHDLSPKSKRPHAPLESPASDGLPTTDSGGANPESNATASAHKSPAKPWMTGSGGKGVMADASPASTTSVAPHQGGGPGFAGGGDQDSSGGTRSGRS